jgi:hypothetical protein
MDLDDDNMERPCSVHVPEYIKYAYILTRSIDPG